MNAPTSTHRGSDIRSEGLRASSRGKTLKRVLPVFVGQSSVLGLALLISVTWTAFASIGSGFLSGFNLYSVGQLAARDAVLGMAQANLVVMARMNLAIGSIGSVCVTLLGFLLVVAHVPLLMALVIVAVAGVVASLIMGVVELWSGLSSFIVTLAFLSVYGGGALLLTRHANYQIVSSTLNHIGSGTFVASAICPLMLVAGACGVVLWLFYNRTSLGWKMRSVGANERAARAAGVNVPRVLLAGYALSGLLCALAAVMEASYELNVNASVGTNWLLPSFVAVVLGGVVLTGGEITIMGILLAALFYDSLQSGLTVLSVPSYWLGFAEGAVLLSAVVADQLRRSRGGGGMSELLKGLMSSSAVGSEQ